MTDLRALFDEYGQSPWIDNIRRDWMNDGTLADLVALGVRGVTSNPAIFAKALATSTAYDEFLIGAQGAESEELFETLAVADVRDACDVLRTVYDSSLEPFRRGERRYRDGFVSLEVSPRLARDAERTVRAAIRLAGAVGRGNVMIKIPATKEGLSAVTDVLAAGINVNVTLIFSIERYDDVITAWMAGLEGAARNGLDVSSIASVASFFVSRVDAAVDALLPDDDPRRGTIANAQVAKAYLTYRTRIASPRAKTLLAAGAQVQRPLWASTSIKNPSYDELLYVERIVGDETVNTMPDPTLRAVQERAELSDSLLVTTQRAKAAAAALDSLAGDVDIDEVTQRLEVEGVDAFVNSYEELLATVAAKIRQSR
jgi:transaldolase